MVLVVVVLICASAVAVVIALAFGYALIEELFWAKASPRGAVKINDCAGGFLVPHELKDEMLAKVVDDAGERIR